MFKLNSHGLISVKEVNPKHRKLAEFVNEVMEQTPFRMPVSNKQEQSLYMQNIKEQRFGASVLQVKLPYQGQEMVDFLMENTRNMVCREITRPDPNNPDGYLRYLERYPIAIGEHTIVYLHRFLKSDDLHLHNHPWNWGSGVVLSGSYNEYKMPDIASQKITVTNRPAGSVGIFTNESVHRVELLKDSEGNDLSGWTLFMHHKDWNYGWGFWSSEEIEAQVYDDFAGGMKNVPSYAFIPKEVNPVPKVWWETVGKTAFIDYAYNIRKKYNE